MPSFIPRLILSAILGGGSLTLATAMTVNLARPYQPNPSPPRQEGVAFYAPGCADFLFDQKSAQREIVCLPYRRSLSLEWTLHHNMVATPLRQGNSLPGYDNNFTIPLALEELAPGFYDLRVKVSLTRDTTVEALTTFGWRVSDMSIHTKKPADFENFWEAALAELSKVDPRPTWQQERTLRGPEIDAYNVASAALPENYDPEGAVTDTVEVYRVKYASIGGAQIEGWYTKPPGDGPFPTLLVLPGAGNNPQPIPAEHARHGYASLDIQVHGNPVDALKYDRPPPDTATSPRERQHFDIYLHALQAVRAIRELPGADPERIAVMGGSQGGRLSVVVAALDPSVKAAIPAIAHFAYRPWGHWVQHLNDTKKAGGREFSGAEKEHGENPADAYLDVLNFADRIRCPVLLNAGLTDAVSPPTGVFAVYQKLNCPKEIIPLPNTGHDWSPAFDRYAWKWLARQLSKGSPAPK